MSATAHHPFGSPLGTSTGGKPVLIAGREAQPPRSEAQARAEAAGFPKIVEYKFYADFINRDGDLECQHYWAPNVDDATDQALGHTRGYGFKLADVDQKWFAVRLADGREMDRRDYEALIEKTVGALAKGAA